MILREASDSGKEDGSPECGLDRRDSSLGLEGEQCAEGDSGLTTGRVSGQDVGHERQPVGPRKADDRAQDLLLLLVDVAVEEDRVVVAGLKK